MIILGYVACDTGSVLFDIKYIVIDIKDGLLVVGYGLKLHKRGPI